MNDTQKKPDKMQPGREILTGVPDGLGPLVLAQLIDEARAGQGAGSLAAAAAAACGAR